MNDEAKIRLERIGSMARSLLASMDAVIASVPKGGPVWHFNSFRQYAVQYNRLLKSVFDLKLASADLLSYFDEDKIPGIGDTIHVQQHSIFQAVHGNLSMLCAWIDSELGSRRTSIEVQTLANFIEASLRPAILGRVPDKEAEIQDTIEKILIGRGMRKGIDYERETGRVRFSIKESIPDFIFRSLSTALEVKFVKEKNRQPRIVDEINADILAYQKGYDHTIFVVYDLGSISDVQEFKRDIESASGNVTVLVIKQ